MADTNEALEKIDLGDYDFLPLRFRHLKRILADNTDYFEQYTSKEVYRKLYNGFKLMLSTIDSLEDGATLLAKKAPLFDYSNDIKGNGYRSLLRLVEHCLHSVTELSAYCQTHRDRFYFRSHHYSLEVEAFANVFQRTSELLHFAKIVLEDSVPDNLFPENFDSKVMLEVEKLDRECFYGRTLGFQFSSGMRHFLQVVCVAMASFAEGYHRHKQSSMACATVSFLNSGKYTVNPEMRAKMIVDVTQKTNMEFCKAFWSLTEGYGLQHVPLLVCSAMKVNRVFFIPPEPFELQMLTGESVSIAPPCSWSGLAPVQVRLLSYEWREGQSKDGSDNVSHHGRSPKPKSDGLILHVHGGGFVAQSSKSHEMYLRTWACELGVPILSIDYSLAPEAPFPRAFEECFFVYAWCLNNFHQLGTTGKCICLAGDSAGGNLCVSLSMRASEVGIRAPDSILAAYAPFNVQWVPSPSRLLSLMDPLLPTGLLGACLAAYSGMGKSPFDDCTTNSIKSLTGETSQPVSVVKRRKTNSLLRLLRVGSKESKFAKSGSHSEALSPSGPESFHSCLSSPQFEETETVNNMASSSTETAVGYHCTSVVHSSGEHSEEGVSDQEKDSEISSPSSGHSRSRRHSQDTIPSRPTSPQRSKHGGGDEMEHIGVHYHRDIEECHLVNVVESPESPSGELLLFPLEMPQEEPYEDVGTSPDEDEEVGHDDKSHSRTQSMSQVHIPIARNPYMSPLLASDEKLKSLPPIDLVACTLDPILDDSVEFARRLRSIGKDVELYILENLPHGFLSFHLASQEAREGNDLCIVCLKRTLSGKRNVGNVEKAPVY